MSFTYTPGIPVPSHIPATDVAAMQTNSTTIANALTVDHYPFNDGRCGKHQWLRFPNPNVPPATGTQEWSFFNNNSGFPSDTGFFDMFFQLPNAGSTDTMFRSKVGLSRTQQGWTQLFGGLIVQWGFINTNTMNDFQTTNFNIPFPNNFYGMFTQVYGTSNEPNPTGTANITLDKSATSLTTFTWDFVTNSGQYTGFYWIALGA